jgi:hypothetical protein
MTMDPDAQDSSDPGSGSGIIDDGQLMSTAPAGSTAPHHEHTAFGDYDVYADSAPVSLDPSSNAVTQTEFHTMQTAWDNIHHGKGLDIQGSDADKAEFDRMLSSGMQHSEAFRQTIDSIGTDTAHTEHVNLGHNQPGTFVDSFATNAVDLSDLEQFPAQARSGHHDEATQTEMIDHFLDERHYAQTHTPGDFSAAHQHAIDNQNQIRDEQRQAHVTAQTGTVNADGTVTADFRYADGKDEIVNLDDQMDVTGVTPPND